jgi:hypothetical protein
VFAPGGEVRGGVDVPIADQAARVAAVGALGEGELGSHRTARRARLRGREPAVRDEELPAVAGRFMRELPGEFRPTLVANRGGEVPVEHHVSRRKVLDDHDPMVADERGGEAVQRIGAPRSRSCMGHAEAGDSLVPVRRPLSRTGYGPLQVADVPQHTAN